MIRHRPRRAAAALVLAAAAAVAAAVPAAAAANSSPIVIDSVSSPPDEPGLLSIQVEAASAITSVTVHINSTPELTLTDLSLAPGSGSAQDGTWTVQTPITTSQLSPGTYQVTVDATDADGTTPGLDAPDPFFFGLYPSVTVNASTTTLSYSEQSVTFTGQVQAYSPTGVLEGVPDQLVSIAGSDGGSWPATTDQNGNYSVTVTPNLSGGTSGLAGSFSASVSAGPAIAQASSPQVELTGDVDPVQVSVSLSKSVVDFGTKVTLSGTAQYEADGIWLPFANSTVDISGTDYYSGRSVATIAATTDGSGSINNVVLPAQPTTTWTANPPPSQFLTSSGTEVGLPNSATLTVVLPTRTTRLHVAYNPAGQITASGCLGLGSAVSSFPDLTAPADTNVYLQYSTTSRGPWRSLGTLDGSGAPKCSGGTGFRGAVTSPALSGHYRVGFTGQLLYQQSASTPESAATVRTRITDFSITPRAVTGNGRIRFTGQLQQKKARGWKALGGVRLTVYVKPAGSSTWYYTTKKLLVSSSGRFRYTFSDTQSAHWAVGFAGNDNHLESLSRILYVSVSGTSASLRRGLTTHSLSARAARTLLAAG